jgi:hypothetical protein
MRWPWSKPKVILRGDKKLILSGFTAETQLRIADKQPILVRPGDTVAVNVHIDVDEKLAVGVWF